ncbi:MAG: hypothetical protein GY928_27160 [Colwellia sp.]|nr:hypothetical protein [Colwellia sp.]
MKNTQIGILISFTIIAVVGIISFTVIKLKSIDSPQQHLDGPVAIIQTTDETSNDSETIVDSTKPNSDTVTTSVIDTVAVPWIIGTEYEKDSRVIHNGSVWIANRKVYQDTPPPESWFWREQTIATNSDTSATEIENYNTNLDYDSGSVVLFKGELFEAKRFVYVGTSPTDNWFWGSVESSEE